MSKYLIVIAGPTAIGKTSTAIQLANHYDCSIISADSRQIYKEMEIGTAKPSTNELLAATHHFIGHVSIHEPYNTGIYEEECIQLLEEIYKTNDYAILCGGTGLYIEAVLNGLDRFPKTDPIYLKSLESKSLEVLQSLLKESDPVYYNEVDTQNSRRLIRALAVIKASGQTFSSFRLDHKKKRAFTPILIFLTMDRPLLYSRINHRVDLMMESGLLDEAKILFPNRGIPALDTVGYREIFTYLANESDLETAIELIKRNSRRYAKRQLTWYRNRLGWKHIQVGNHMNELWQYIDDCVKNKSRKN